jgi:peptide/nickel transport system substrate-binding protein
VLGLDKSQYAIVKEDPALNVYRSPANHVRALRFNTTKSVFQDIRLRQAVSVAIDRKALIAGTQFGLGRIASCLYPEDHSAHNPELKPVAYDPTRAKQLLAEAGYAKGLSVRGYFTSSTAGQTVADAIKNMLAKVGIDWQTEPLAPAAVAARMKPRARRGKAARIADRSRPVLRSQRGQCRNGSFSTDPASIACQFMFASPRKQT